MQPVNLCHCTRGPARSRVWLVTSTGFTAVSGSQVPRITSISGKDGVCHPDHTRGRRGHSSRPWPGMLTTPAGVQKLQLKPEFQPAASPSSISQDPSDTKTLTGPGMRMLCQRSWLRARNAPQRPSILLDVVSRGVPGSEGYPAPACLRWRGKGRGNVKMNWGSGRHLPKQEHVHPWLRQHFPRRDESDIYIFTYATNALATFNRG